LADLGLRADLAFEAAAWPFFAAALALWGGLGFPTAVAVAWAGSRFSVVDVVMVVAPLAVITRDHDMDHSEALAWQVKSLEIRKRRWNGDASRKRGTQLTLRDEPRLRPINRLGSRAWTVYGLG
jgi:hypothetical protein